MGGQGGCGGGGVVPAAAPQVDVAAGRRGGADPYVWCASLAAALASGDDARAALGAVCETVRELLPCDRVQVWRGDVRQAAMRTMLSSGYPEAQARRLEEIAVPMRRVRVLDEGFLTDKVRLVTRADPAADAGSEMFDGFGIEAALFLLLERGDHMLGALQLSWCGGADVRLPGSEILEAIRLHASLAVDFLARTDDALRLSTNLSETATLLASIHDPDVLLQAMAAKVAEAVGCDWASVHLLDGDGPELTRVALHGFATPPIERFSSASALEWVAKAIAASDDGVLEVPDVRSVAELTPYVGAVEISSYLAVPLREDDRLVGMLTIGYRRYSGRFARRQIALAKGLAHHALIALRNARLVRSLREANQVKADFIAAVSHDLRTPLHVLIGYSAMLLEGAAGGLNGEQRALVTRMHDCSVHFLDMINGVLGLGRLESGVDRVSIAGVALDALCADILREVEYLRRPEVELRCDADALVVESDRGKLSTILRNLVTNALKFTNHGFVAIEAHGTEGGGFVLRVRDTGPGIAAQERPKIFEMFRQGAAGLRAGGSGLGLGLYLVKRLTDMLGGEVELLSPDGGETVFEVRIPGAAMP